ncbi:hypothetical protein AB1Y20_007165 [Prymnesium parvum]|uniref:Uncharacterized protein n=1 Tax=Prymnesium parvum TaxID=97485 RepID=A0AB34IWV4_PRYPA
MPAPQNVLNNNIDALIDNDMVLPPQPRPSADFRPNSIQDLLERPWFDKLSQWYASLGSWLLDLSEAVHVEPPGDQEAIAQVLAARPGVLVVPASGFVEAARGIVWGL